jgi:hypothetical protein
LGLWQGNYHGVERFWLRWYDQNGNWIPTPEEQERHIAQQERQNAEEERQKVQELQEKLARYQERFGDL